MIEIKNVKEIVETPEIANALRRYKYVTGALFDAEVDADYTFQKSYCDLYGLVDNFSEDFKTQFFFVLEKMKRESNISFGEALEKLHAIENKNEMTASSILVHTINPRFPVYDPKTAKELFDLEAPEEGASFERCCKRYDDFSNAFYVYANSPEGDALVRAFDAKFPNAEIPDVIKIGFITWQVVYMK